MSFVVFIDVFCKVSPHGCRPLLQNYRYHRYLREEAVIKAVAQDSEKLLEESTISRICAQGVPQWSANPEIVSDPLKHLTVTHIKSHNNNIFRVSLANSSAATDAVIYRIGGQRFRRRPWREIELLAWLRRVDLGSGVVTPLVPEYFGQAYPLGRIEQCLPGRALGTYTVVDTDTLDPDRPVSPEVNLVKGGTSPSKDVATGAGGPPTPTGTKRIEPRYYIAIATKIGASLARMHQMLADPEFQTRYMALHYADWEKSILWRRVESWKLLVRIAVDTGRVAPFECVPRRSQQHLSLFCPECLHRQLCIGRWQLHRSRSTLCGHLCTQQ